jgi:hypothetical protein
MMTNAMLVAGGTLEKSTSSASRPPADEPIPTMGKLLFSLSAAEDVLAFSRGGAIRDDCDGGVFLGELDFLVAFLRVFWGE